jgi:hypothetical protein
MSGSLLDVATFRGDVIVRVGSAKGCWPDGALRRGKPVMTVYRRYVCRKGTARMQFPVAPRPGLSPPVLGLAALGINPSRLRPAPSREPKPVNRRVTAIPLSAGNPFAPPMRTAIGRGSTGVSVLATCTPLRNSLPRFWCSLDHKLKETEELKNITFFVQRCSRGAMVAVQEFIGKFNELFEPSDRHETVAASCKRQKSSQGNIPLPPNWSVSVNSSGT